jgi:hypothetical protein
MQQFSEEFLRQWEHIISQVNTTEIPLECMKKVTIKLKDNKRKTINLVSLKKQGLSWEEIESVLSRSLCELESDVRDVVWVVDVTAVAEIVQPQTDKMLSSLK